MATGPIGEALFLGVFWTWVACATLFLRKTVLPRLPLIDPAAYGLAADTVQFRSTDGVLLESWRVPASEPARPWIILCHGVGANRADLLDVAASLHAADFNLLLMDFRGHGGSGGRSTSFGWREQRDLEGALTFLGQQPDIPPAPYGVLGVSMGGVVGLLVGARDERIGAVVAEAPYDNLQEALRTHVKLAYPSLPVFPLLGFILVTYRLRFGVWPRHVAPDRHAGGLSPRPLLVIHGVHDAQVSTRGIQRVLDAAIGPKELWRVDGAEHLGARACDPSGYRARIAMFFTESLKVRRAHGMVMEAMA